MRIFSTLAVAVLVFAVAAPVLSAAEPKTKTKSKEKAAPESAAGKTDPAKARTVAEIAELVRPSLVVVSHVGRDGKVDGVGTGFVVSSNGLIATSLHVIGEGRPVTVQFANGQRYEATAIHAWDRKVDLAIVKIDADNLPALPLGDSDSLKQGTPVVAMGNPRGLDHSVVSGVVSARRDIESNEMIQIAIPIEPGNSGGPLLDMQGRVHGILTLKSAVTENLGFAMPVNALKPLLAKPNPVAMAAWLTLGSLNQKEWSPLFGARWSQKSGRISVEAAGKGFGGRALLLTQKEVPSRPYELSVTVKLDDEAGAAGLAFESDGEDRHYGFYPSAGQMRLTRFDGPNVFSWTILKQLPTPHYRAGDWNTLKVRVEKDKILCYVNDQLVCESSDTDLSGGKAGLAKFRETKAVFKDFQLGKTVKPAEIPADVITKVTKQIENLATTGKPDPALVDALQPHAQASQTILADRAKALEREARQLRKLAVAVHQKSVETELVKLLEQPEDKIDLFYAALLIARLDNAELDVEGYRRQLDQMAKDIKDKLAAKTDERSRLDALTSYLFLENGFHGSRSDYYNRANSYINDVLDDREGMPITLSVVFIELARRIGLEGVAGVPLPSHFIVRYAPKKGEPQWLDVFEGAKPMSRDDAANLVRLNTGSRLRDEDLEPATKRQIIVRILRNLLSSAVRDEAPENPLRYFNLIIALDPDAVRERFSRALLLMQTGEPKAAREDLIWILDQQPRGVDLERVQELVRELGKQK